jgi:hypothetical protein
VGWLGLACWVFPPPCYSLVRTCAYGTVVSAMAFRGAMSHSGNQQVASYSLLESLCQMLCNERSTPLVIYYIRILPYGIRLIALYLERFDLISMTFVSETKRSNASFPWSSAGVSFEDSRLHQNDVTNSDSSRRRIREDPVLRRRRWI